MKSNVLYSISRWVMALLFIFSGVAKSINPFGLSIQLGDYFSVMGLAFLKPLAGLGGVLLPSLELLLGVMLALGLSRKIAAWGTLLSMSFFTLLTLWIALFNPVTDCGCFGDLVKLTNWETFIKNIILLPFAVVLFIGRTRYPSTGKMFYLAAIPLSVSLSFYSWFNLPLIDATPYKIGVNIAQSMSVPQGAEQAEVETLLLYKNIKEGTIHEFKIDDPEWQDDSKWEYVETKSKTIREGYTPPITNLPMVDVNGQDMTHDILAYDGVVTLVVTNDFDNLAIDTIDALRGRVVVLTSARLPVLPPFQHAELYNSDYSVISTMIQNRNGGILILDNGTIVKKEPMRKLR